MAQIQHCNGQLLRDMFAAATAWLEKSAADIDSLNVFPVPDGDTGTNMLLTMRSTLNEAHKVNGDKTSAVAQAMARGALMGARGNSGVILSQIFRGIAKSLDSAECLNGLRLSTALHEAAATAYRALSRPVEGTMLTVIREAAEAARVAAMSDGADIQVVLQAAVDEARDSVARTPGLLPVLREAGVVDAGGQGLYVLLEGALRFLRGETEEMQYQKPRIVPSAVLLQPVATRTASQGEEPYGYCTEFLLQGDDLDTASIGARLEELGKSVIVVGDGNTVHAHVHSLDPGSVLSYAASLGTMHQVKVQNMDDQHQDYLSMQKSLAPVVDCAIVAVVSGQGLTNVFSSLGVSATVSGGQTMNPSTEELLRAAESTPSEKVIILPNNKNIVLTAQQVRPLTTRRLEVVPSESIPQGIAALLAFSYEADFADNVAAMNRALAAVQTI